jgi:hypothetical protein
MLIKKIARNHPEDTLSDIIWCLCKQDNNFAKTILSKFVSFIEDFDIIDIVRNYVLKDGYMPDLTFLLRHKKKNKIIYIIIETKIEASQNIYSNKKRTKKQYDLYTKYQNNKNLTAGLAQKYKIPSKCILLCPSWYEKYDENDPVIDFRFPILLKMLKNSENKETSGIRNELIKYIKEEFEGINTDIGNSLEILKHKNELGKIQNQIRTIRDVMLNQKEIIKSGLWKKNSYGYYFEIGMKNKYSTSKKNANIRSWLTYSFYYDDDISSPLKLYFPKKMISKGIIQVPQYQNKNQFSCDILTECQINKEFFKIFDHIHCDKNIPQTIMDFVEYYTIQSKHQYLVQYNQMLNAILVFNDKFYYKMEYDYHVTYHHNFSSSALQFNFKLKKFKNSIRYLDLIIEPTNKNILDILRIEIFEKNEKLETISLFENFENGYTVKYDLDELKKIVDSFLW